MAKKNKISAEIFSEINEFTTYITEIGLSIANNNQTKQIKRKAFNEPDNGTKKIQKCIEYIAPSVKNEDHTIIFDNQIEYKELYSYLDEQRNYNMKLVDGALVSLVYEILESSNEILTHRLTFFPSPYLFANDFSMDIISQEELYSDIISKNIYPFPIRFDFDLYHSVDLEHPKSHLTLGQYKNCRIPVTSAVTPGKFIIFILRNFYSAYYNEHKINLNKICKMFEIDASITDNEKEISHFVVK